MAKKEFKLVWRYPKLLSGFLANDHLSRVSRQSHLSANDKDDNEMIPGAVHRSPDICLTAEENLGETSARRLPIKAIRPVIASNGVPYYQ